jgi:hypothetical protein
MNDLRELVLDAYGGLEINMLSVWNLMQRELLRCTEALLTCFACILAHAGDAPSVAMVKV